MICRTGSFVDGLANPPPVLVPPKVESVTVSSGGVPPGWGPRAFLRSHVNVHVFMDFVHIFVNELCDFVYSLFMRYEEFKRQLGKAGLTIAEFAELVKLNRKSISNYSKHGDIPSHLAVIITLLAEMAERKIDFRPILLKLQIEVNKPRGAGKGRFGGNKQIDLF